MARNPTLAWTLILFFIQGIHSFLLPNATLLENILNRYRDEQPHSRTRRAISLSDKEEILALHNKLRGQVYPSASNMEYMHIYVEIPWLFVERAIDLGPVFRRPINMNEGSVNVKPNICEKVTQKSTWDDELERSAESWAHQCIWDHGPQSLLMSIGQNLGVHWGRYELGEQHGGSQCVFQGIVWATTNKVGCAVNVCQRMDVWGQIWENAVYLVCNYSPKGNWIGEAPYKNGRPCSECPPSYGGRCQNNLCYKDDTYIQKPEREETNEVEIPQERVKPQPTKPVKAKKPTTATYMTQVIKCDTKMRDKCKGSTCNRYLCPAGCLNNKAKVFGTFNYESSSSICRAAIHSGVLDNRGGLVDITRKGRSDFFIKSTRNGIESLSKFKPSNAFVVSKVTVQTLDCYTTVEELCPFKKPATHCPRSYCPAYCKDEPSYWAPVYGTNVYADNSSICKTAVHAGVLAENEGGYVDVMPVDKKKYYSGSLKNGIRSER
ncbi:hypothetical protein JD844_000512 [Phrynosoma platyrhinos]|uniref:LCCL domain-containing protein n=1 Tax=Phrynosoma platyrhinos TaxID=52577 RepID=A0ABQ7SQT4_PHRPL|nr:hypothetical protein JD844_000512 [Phrynosoma platyrhinos]